jgi:hypothetical protein
MKIACAYDQYKKVKMNDNDNNERKWLVIPMVLAGAVIYVAATVWAGVESINRTGSAQPPNDRSFNIRRRRNE